MTGFARTRLLCAVVSLSVVGAVAADPLADLLPPQTRQLEKRTLLGGDQEAQIQSFYRGGNNMRPGASISADGKLLASSNPFTGTAIWDLATGRNLGLLNSGGGGQGSTIVFAPDGKHLVTVNWANGRHGGSCPVTLWDAKKREKIRSLDEDVNDTLFVAAAFAPDGKTLALSGGMSRRGVNNGLYFWDAGTGDEIRHLDGIVPVDPARRLSGIISAPAYAPDGRSLALLADGKVHLLELATSKVRTQLSVGTNTEARPEQGNEVPAGALAFAPDGRTLAVGCPDGAARRFDLRTGRELPPLTGHASGIIALSFAPDGKRLLSFDVDQKLFFWRADANRNWQPKALPPGDPAIEQLWDTLRTDDPLDLYGCAQLFGAASDGTVAFLSKRLAAVPVGDSARIEKLVADLQKPGYNDRKKAANELRNKIGVLALPALRKAAESGNDELVQRLQFEFESLAPPRDRIRAVRALEILERIGTDNARKLLAELAKGAPEAPLTIEAKAALERSSKSALGRGTTSKLETLWQSLLGDDSAAAFHATRQFVARPVDAVPFLSARLRELAASDVFDNDPQRLAKLVADLDSEDFETRDKASKALKTLGKPIEPVLRRALEGQPSVEVKRQIEETLAEIGRQTLSGEVLAPRSDAGDPGVDWDTGVTQGAGDNGEGGTWTVAARDATAASLRRQGS